MNTTVVTTMAIDPELAKALKRLSGRANEAVQKRDAAIVAARQAGATLRELEAVTGINHVTIKRFLDRREAAEPGPDQDITPDGRIVCGPSDLHRRPLTP